jgi:ferredoxin-NADP reductase
MDRPDGDDRAGGRHPPSNPGCSLGPTFKDIIYREELRRRSVSRSPYAHPSDFELTGLRRRVDRAMLEDVTWPPADTPLTFVCGPTGFVESVAGSLVELGHDPQEVRTERFGPTGGLQ